MITEVELSILDWIAQHLRCGFLDATMPVISAMADLGVFWILLALVFLLQPRTRKCGCMILLALVLNLLVCNAVLKPLVARSRPFEFREVVLLVPRPTDYSFPSGHTAASFAAASAMICSRQRGRWATLVLAGLIAFSRMYLYVHFPTDVFGGILVGAFCGILVVYFVRKTNEKLQK